MGRYFLLFVSTTFKDYLMQMPSAVKDDDRFSSSI